MKTENKVPCHVAIIMDGNGRWAELRGMERLYGHMEGVNAVRTSLQAALEAGVKYLTLYAFSTENWGRPKAEVEGLMSIFCSTIVEERENLVGEGVRVLFMGDIEGLAREVQQSVRLIEKETESNERLTLIIALNYSSASELVRMARRIAEQVQRGELKPEKIETQTLYDNLYLKSVPFPDLLIRTSGEQRLSNFMLLQLAYSEFYFTKVLWPDFGKEEFARALEEYAQRKRRYGLVEQNGNMD